MYEVQIFTRSNISSLTTYGVLFCYRLYDIYAIDCSSWSSTKYNYTLYKHTGKWFRVGYEFTDLAMSLLAGSKLSEGIRGLSVIW